MVAMVAGLLLVAAVSALFATIIKANRTAMQVSRLNQELQAVTDMIARDIQRAGYDAKAVSYIIASGALSPSPFYFNTTTDLASGCVRVKYDYNDNGVLDNPSDADNAGETRLYYLSSADKGIKLAGSSATCTGGALISSKDTIDVTALNLTMLSGSVSTGARTIRLVISGNDSQSPTLKLSLQRDIKLRNDGY